jgi:hypothetical protein
MLILMVTSLVDLLVSACKIVRKDISDSGAARRSLRAIGASMLDISDNQPSVPPPVPNGEEPVYMHLPRLREHFELTKYVQDMITAPQTILCPILTRMVRTSHLIRIFNKFCVCGIH